MADNDPNEWMWERAAELLERADKAQRRFFHLQQDARRACWEPPIDVLESEHEIAILIALPGVREVDIEIALDHAVLLVSARRSLPEALVSSAVRRLEIPQGRFERRIPLAPGQYELTERRVVDGCLWLRIGKVS